jgi:chemotaxis signal transduction protein
MQLLVLFQRGNMQFALDRNCIKDIRPIPVKFTQAQGRIQQHTIEIEGRLLLLIDLAAASSQDSALAHPSNGKIIVLKGSPSLALLADDINPAIYAGADQMDELPSVFAGTALDCFPKVLRLEEQVALVIDTTALAEFETCAAASMTGSPARHKQATQNRGTSLDANGGQLNSITQRIDTQEIEAIIAEKLKTIISLRVQDAVAQALRRHIGRIG